jgi:3-hydroxybutyrate dehydrogenase
VAFMEKEGLARAEAEKAFMASRQPSGRFVEPEGVAALVALLCGPGGRDITGAAIPIDGGWSAS